MRHTGTATKVHAVPRQLAVPSDLDAAGRRAAAEALNPLVADAFALYVKVKNFHWHVSGPHFPDYHRLLDRQAEQVMNMTDALAERSRKLGQATIHSVGEIARLQRVQDDDRMFVEPFEMLRILMTDNRDLAERMRAAHRVCAEAGDVASTSLLENFIDEAERRTWFLFEATLS
ncbi:MAG TPA: DNA starvation/stationary phase protection protein [Candidatus Dormibacteraeota bacterium]|nr:DNA starvation/stationary phase protection protein [Candidatus Dormibacteraeota bacterium]